MIYRTVNLLSKALFGTVWTALSTSAQPGFENIRPVAHQDTITITYDLIGAQPGQQFRVKAFCWNGYEERPLNAISGYTLVGRGRHKLDWRVLSDTDLLVGDSITFTLIAYPPDDIPITDEDKKKSLFEDLTRQVDSYLEETYNHALPFRDYGEHLYESRTTYYSLLKKLEKWNAMHDTLLGNRRTFEAKAAILWGEDAKIATEAFFSNLFEIKHRDLKNTYNENLYKRIKDGADGNYHGLGKREFIRRLKADIFLLTQQHILPQLDLLKADAKALYNHLPL